jgi:aminoglycoside phosphotransferase (APT) family kinase protein
MRYDAKQSPTPGWIESLRERFPTERTVDSALTRKLRLRAGPPHRPQSQQSVAERLTKFLSKRLAEPFTLSGVRSLAGGSSKEQFFFQVDRSGGSPQPHSAQYVLRLQPAESIVETHRLREFQVIRALQGIIPVPEAYWVDPQGEELGQPALIIGFCEGVTRPPTAAAVERPRKGFGPKYRELLAPQFVEALAMLGRFDWSGADLSAFDVPRLGTTEGVASGINWWERVWEEDSVEPVPLMTLAANWLRANAPPIDRVSILHGDFRGGNFLFLPDSGRVTAYLDWELVRLGDRHEDLAYFLKPMFGEVDEQGTLLAGGLMRREEFLREYARISDLPVDPWRLAYYEVFVNWRSAVISLATAARCAIGQKTHQDIRVGWIGTAAPQSLFELHAALKKVM